MSASEAKLFESFQLAKVTLPNRIVKSAICENLCDGLGGPTDEMMRLYERWAKGGTGLIITGHAAVLPGQGLSTLHLEFGRREAEERMALLVERVHAVDTRIFVQLNHPGSQIWRARCRSMEPVSSSRRISTVNYRLSRALSVREIHDMIEAFARSADSAKACGFDGVQVLAAHGWLHTQFLSPHYNKRTDEWGGNAVNRRRFLLETVRAIRRRVGEEYPVVVKLNATDGLDDGVTREEAVETAVALQEASCDAIEVSGGCGESAMGFFATRGDFPPDLVRTFVAEQGEAPWWLARPLTPLFLRNMARKAPFRPGYFLEYAPAFKRRLRIPVMVVGGFRKRSDLEDAVGSGKADLVSIARPLVREPGLPERMRGSKEDVEFECTSCNRCFLSVGLGKALRCYSPARSRDGSSPNTAC